MTGKAHCFNCGKAFRDVDYLKKALQEKLNTGEWKLAMEAIKSERKKKPVAKLPEDFVALGGSAKNLTHWDRVALEFLRSRGVTEHQMQEKSIGYSVMGEMAYRIIIPVYYQGRLEGLIGRTFLKDEALKYKNSLGNKTLYNVPQKPNKAVVLSEGAFDALAIERALPVKAGMDSEAVLGTALTDRQLEIVDIYDRIILYMDPDRAGIKAIIRIGRQLMDLKKNVGVVVPEFNGHPECDPSDLSSNAVLANIRASEPYTSGLELRLKTKLAFVED